MQWVLQLLVRKVTAQQTFLGQFTGQESPNFPMLPTLRSPTGPPSDDLTGDPGSEPRKVCMVYSSIQRATFITDSDTLRDLSANRGKR